MNSVFINEHDVIEIIVDGDQSNESVAAMANDSQLLCVDQHLHGNKALVLDNLIHMGTVPLEARRTVVEAVKTMEYDKLAMVGNGMLLRLAANLVLQAIGKSRKVKYFENYDEAIAWLKK